MSPFPSSQERRKSCTWVIQCVNHVIRIAGVSSDPREYGFGFAFKPRKNANFDEKVEFMVRSNNKYNAAHVVCEKVIDSIGDQTSNSTIRTKLAELREQINSALNKFEWELQRLQGEKTESDEVGELRAENGSLKQKLDRIKKLLGVAGH